MGLDPHAQYLTMGYDLPREAMDSDLHQPLYQYPKPGSSCLIFLGMLHCSNTSQTDINLLRISLSPQRSSPSEPLHLLLE